MHLRLAGWMVELRVQPPELAGLMERRYQRFTCQPQGPADLVVAVDCALRAVVGDDANGSILHASLTRRGEEYLLDGGEFYGIIDPSHGSAELRMRSDDPAREIEYFLRSALALFVLKRDGLLLHCAALSRTDSTSSDGGTGAVTLFVGQSGSGKSTVVALSRAAGRAKALGDDLILLRHECGRWRAYGTPFWNLDTSDRDDEAESGIVAAIFKLVQDRSVFVEPMSRAAAAAELLANCPIVNDQPALLDELIDRCREAAGTISVRRLHFRKDDAFWDVIAQEAPC